MTFTPPPRSTVFRFYGFFPLDCFWRFLRLELFIFLLGFLKVFRILTVRIWSVFCVIGLGSLIRAFYMFLVLPTPRSVLGPGWSLLLVCVLFFRPADPPTQYGAMVWVIGPLNRGTGLQVFRVRFFCRPANALLLSLIHI